MKRPPDHLISLREASAMTGLAVDTVRRLCRNGTIPFQQIGPTYGIPETVAQRLRDKLQPPDGYITVGEAIDLTGVSRSRVHQLIDDEKITAIRREWFGTRRVWVEKNSVMEWIRRRDNEH